MKTGSLALCAILTLALPAAAQNAATTAPATTTVTQEGCAGSVAEACNDAQSQTPAPGAAKHLGFDPLPTPPPQPVPINLPNFTPPQTPRSAPPPVIPPTTPVALPSTTVLAPPSNGAGTSPVAVQSQPGAAASQ
jgi:hypothetical protein